MKIGRPKTAQSRSRTLLKSFAALALAFLLGLLIGEQEWLSTLRHQKINPAALFQAALPAADLPTLVVDMAFADYNIILNQREKALQSGVCITSAQDFVPATIRVGNTETLVRMRLREGLATSLGENEKWGFQVRTRDNQLVLGLQRFYLLDPALNNGLNQWAFARALESEGILTARYRFVRLVLNGDDRGIYALQEGFADELPAAQGRPEGVMVEFDSDLLWESIAHFQGDAQAGYADPIANLSASDWQYFEVDTFRDASIARHPELAAHKDRAIGLLRSLQTGELSASQVFDTAQYARFLALVDLWGATPGTSLVNLRYYYNPLSGRLEPIGFNGNPLASEARLSLAAAYGDPALQAAYAQEALRLSQPGYVEQVQSELAPEWQQLQRALSAEYGQLEPPWAKLQARAEQISRSLDPVQPVFAYLGPPTLSMSATLRIDVGNILNLPVEIVGFDIGGATFLPAERRWLQEPSTHLLTDDAAKAILRAFDASVRPVIRYAQFHIPLTYIQSLDEELDFSRELEIQVVTRILGLSEIHRTAARQGYPEPLPAGALE